MVHFMEDIVKLMDVSNILTGKILAQTVKDLLLTNKSYSFTEDQLEVITWCQECVKCGQAVVMIKLIS